MRVGGAARNRGSRCGGGGFALHSTGPPENTGYVVQVLGCYLGVHMNTLVGRARPAAMMEQDRTGQQVEVAR